MAAVLACGDPSALGHLAGAKLLRVSRFPAPLIAVVTASKRRPDGIEVHRLAVAARRNLALQGHSGHHTVPRLLIDLADELTAHQLANVIHEAAFRRLFNLEATREALARAHGRRVKTVERAVALHLGGSAGTKSSLEDAFLERCAVEPLVNTKVAGLEVDFCWPDRRLVVEVDGPGHARAPTRREDFERERKLEAAGYDGPPSQ